MLILLAAAAVLAGFSGVGRASENKEPEGNKAENIRKEQDREDKRKQNRQIREIWKTTLLPVLSEL